jgi:O-antigen/teichoic acid export membrane protein
VVSLGAVFVNRYFGVAVLGNYRAAFDLGSKIWFFSNGLGLIIFPKFSQLLAAGEKRESLYKKMSLWIEKSWTGYLIISLLAALCAPWLLPLVKLGDTQIVTFFKLLIVGLCLNAHTTVSYEYLLADNRYGAVACLSVAVLFILCLTYFPLVKFAGPYAIGWAWIVSQSLYAFAADALVIRTGIVSGSRLSLMIFVKVFMFTMTGVCLFAGLCLISVHIFYPAALMLAAGLFILLKDFKELRLFLS